MGSRAVGADRPGGGDEMATAHPADSRDHGAAAGASGRLRELLAFLRVAQLPRYGRRLLGLRTSRPEDFLVPLAPCQSARLAAIAAAVRGATRPPAIFIHGVLPRSGTNFLADALALHPDVHLNPGHLWEFPLLYVAPGSLALEHELVAMFRLNREVIERYELLGYLASGWIADLQRRTGGRRMVLKSPHVQGIGLFRHVFPDDILLLCLRDGRDVIQSSLKTFGRWRPRSKGFTQLAWEWRHATEAILTFEAAGANAYPRAMVVRYEDLVERPEETMCTILRHAGLDPGRYDHAALARLPVRGSSAMPSADAGRWREPQDKPAEFRPVGRWQGDWSAGRRRRFKAIAGEVLVRAGYAADLDW